MEVVRLMPLLQRDQQVQLEIQETQEALAHKDQQEQLVHLDFLVI